MATVMVTGSTGGIGKALVAMLKDRGDDVIGVGRDADRIAAVGAQPVVADFSAPETFADAVPNLDRLDALVHSAGVVTLGHVADTPYHVWLSHLTVNLGAAAELTRLMLPALRAGSGHVVFVNSGSGLRANPNWSAYAASKFGLRALADALRAEEGVHGVRVTSVHPGRTATEMQRSVRQQEGAEYDPKRYIQAETAARLVLAALDTPHDAEVTEISVRSRQ